MASQAYKMDKNTQQLIVKTIKSAIKEEAENDVLALMESALRKSESKGFFRNVVNSIKKSGGISESDAELVISSMEEITLDEMTDGDYKALEKKIVTAATIAVSKFYIDQVSELVHAVKKGMLS